MYLKRNNMPKTWPLRRKGTKYLVRPSSLRNSIPLLIVLRDMLKVVKNKKEAKEILNVGKIKINGKTIKEAKYSLTLFDILSLNEKNFKMLLKNKRFDVSETKENNEKISKVIGKKVLKKGKIQINLSDGKNYLSKDNIKTGDSVIIDFKENKISEILPLKQGSKILFIAGKHMGREGGVDEIDEKKKLIYIKVGGERINSKLNNIIVIK